MGAKTSIEWTRGADGTPGATWTPIRARNLATGKIGWHCTHESPGCINCYSETFNMRLGTGLPFKPGHRKDIEIFLDEKMLLAPLRWYAPRKIFVCSMTDLFADFVTDEMIDRMFGVMALCPQHTFQVLTKRPARMERYFDGYEEDGGVHVPLKNVLLGCSIEDQRRAHERREPMRRLALAGWKTWVSYEPALENIDWKGWEFLSWIVCGAESGHNARPMSEDCATTALEFCRRSGASFFMKQMSGPKGRAIKDIDRFPANLQIREAPA